MHQQIGLINYYLVGRLVFAIALQVAFHLTGDLFVLDRVVLLIGLYGFLALIRLIINPKGSHPLDFVLDIFFVTAIVYTGFHFYSYSYLTLLYLFPIFFASLSIREKWVFMFPVITILLYSSVYFFAGVLPEKDNLINIALHFIAFISICFAGNQVSERLMKQANYIKKLEEERIKMQGYERLFRLSADLAHELRNPLASISASIQLIKEGKDIKDFIDMLEDDIKRINNLIRDFLMFSRPSDALKERIDLSGLIFQITNNYKQERIQLGLDIQEGIFINANRTFIEVALGNILKNAIEAAKSKVKVTLKALSDIEGLYPERKNLIVVEDDGEGLKEGLKDKVFEPFFTTKPKGTGLGLAIAYRIITDLGGSISIERSELGGACFIIALPGL